jgi:hypothetical protein
MDIFPVTCYKEPCQVHNQKLTLLRIELGTEIWLVMQRIGLGEYRA